MKRTTNKIMSALCMTSILISAGCAGTQNAEKKSSEQKDLNIKKSMETEIGTEKVIQDKKIKINKIDSIKDENVSEKEQVLKVSFDIKNEGKEDSGIGSGDFYIKDKNGSEYTMYSHEDNFGDVISSGKSIKGNGYYKIPKNAGELILVYSPVMQQVDKKTIEWKIGSYPK